MLKILEEKKLSIGTHRPEIFKAKDKIYIAVVRPKQEDDRLIKHSLIELDLNLNETGFGFPLTWKMVDYGEPSDHRVIYVNNLLYIFQQCNVWPPDFRPTVRGPMENFSKEQSMYMRAFNLKGKIIMEKALVPHVFDFSQDNFPDFCVLYSDKKFYLCTGTRHINRVMNLRIFDLNWNLLEKKTITEEVDTIGNSLFVYEDRFYLITTLNGRLYEFTYDVNWNLIGNKDIGGNRTVETFPTGIINRKNGFLVSHIATDKRVQGIPEEGFDAYLKSYDSKWNLEQDLKICSGGFAHTHPTLLRDSERILYACSRRTGTGIGGGPPQVSIFVIKDDD